MSTSDGRRNNGRPDQGLGQASLVVRGPADLKEAKNASLTHVAMKPGDTDREFFAYYSADQLDFVTTYGEELSMIAYDRYGEG